MDLIRSKLVGGGSGRGAAARAEIASQCEAVAQDFQASFYLQRYPEVTGDPLQHFMTTGWKKGRDPAPWFSTNYYLENNRDVAEAGLNPFYHYVQHGRAEGRPIAPAGQPANDRAWEVDAIRSGLDEGFYADELRRRNVDPAGLDLALHYWREGASLGLNPAQDFSTSHYVAAHADVVAAGVNPFAHYLGQGRGEGRTAYAVEAEPAPPPAPTEDTPLAPADDDQTLVARAFDAEYYLGAYPDVAAAGVDPLQHFMKSGWREGRNPNLWFSCSDYLEFYPDVEAAGINPFLHYVMAGKSEGRVPRHDLGYRYDVIKSLQPLEERIEQARAWSPKPKPSSSSKLGEALRRATRSETKGLYISVSHDDFTENVGGVQLVLMRESAAVDAMGLDHLHLFPATSIPVVELDDKDPILGVLLNKKRVGFFRSSEIERELCTVAPRLKSRPFAIHSLIRHDAASLVSLLKAAGCTSGWYWAHDYSSICTGYTLLRNDVEFCGGPPPESAACSICVYGELRRAQMKAHELLFEALDLTVVAPSDAALDVWKGSASVAAPARVHEHMAFTLPEKGKSAAPTRDRPLRIAYVGQAVSHKGWLAFRELALEFGKDPRYEFYHLGKEQYPGVPVIFREIAVGPDDLDRMVRTISELEIDVALLWSLWPETFCIAAAEAFRAGASVLTFKDSGNVAAMVRKTGFGAVLDSEEELARLFKTGELAKLASATRPSGVKADYSDMTADLIQEELA